MLRHEALIRFPSQGRSRLALAPQCAPSAMLGRRIRSKDRSQKGPAAGVPPASSLPPRGRQSAQVAMRAGSHQASATPIVCSVQWGSGALLPAPPTLHRASHAREASIRVLWGGMSHARAVKQASIPNQGLQSAPTAVLEDTVTVWEAQSARRARRANTTRSPPPRPPRSVAAVIWASTGLWLEAANVKAAEQEPLPHDDV